MQSWQICGIGVITAVAALIVKQFRGEMALPVRLSGSIVILGVVLGLMVPVYVYLDQLTSGFRLGEYGGVLLKALGIALMTHIGAELCRDCGESGVASCVELAGKCEILLLSLPLIASVMDAAREILSWQR